MTVTLYDVAWCAGVIDTIGLLRLRDTDAGSRLPVVSISTTNHPLAQRLGHLTGVRLTTVSRRYNRLGCGEHCTEPHLHVDSTTSRWSLTGSRARLFLYGIRPYLHVKGDEVDTLLAGSEEPAPKPRTIEKMVSLGWPRQG